MIGERIGRYQIIEQIGAGGMGRVYRAQDQGRQVALKVLPPHTSSDPHFNQRFKREAEALKRLVHPHIVAVYDVGEHQGQAYIVMQLLTGGTLRDRQGRLTLAAFLRVIEQLAGALDHAHRQGIVHRDVKPSNVLFDDQGNAFLGDFGIAKVLDANTHLTGSGLIGTPAYMSPEQFTGQGLDHRSDQYSLAILCYEALTGRLPFEGNTAEMMFKHIQQPPPVAQNSNTRIPAAANLVLTRALAKSPAERYETVHDFAIALADAAMSSLSPEEMTTMLLPASAVKKGATPTPTASPLAQDYKAGLEAMRVGDLEAALAAFDRVLAVDERYREARRLRTEVNRSLIASTRPPRPAPAAATSKVKPAVVSPASSGETLPGRRPVLPANPSPVVARAAVAPPRLTLYGRLTSRSGTLYLAVGLGGLILLAVLAIVAVFLISGSGDDPVVAAENTATVTPQLVALEQPIVQPTPPPGMMAVFAAGPGATILVAGEAEGTQALAAGDQVRTEAGATITAGEAILELSFSDGSQLYLEAGTELILETLAGADGAAETRLRLNRGRLLAQAPAATRLLIASRVGGEASTVGGLMGVFYQEDGQLVFSLDCFEGTCRLEDYGGELELAAGEYSQIDSSGAPAEAAAVRHELYYPLAPVRLPAPTPTTPPTETPTFTPTPTSTRRPVTPTPSSTPAPVATPTRVDSDNDGIPDVSDGCPNVPGPGSNGGCPLPPTNTPPPPDNDGDGVPDYNDDCPDEPGPASNDGCPIDEPPPLTEEPPPPTIET